MKGYYALCRGIMHHEGAIITVCIHFLGRTRDDEVDDS